MKNVKNITDAAFKKLDNGYDDNFVLEVPAGKNTVKVTCRGNISAVDMTNIVNYITDVIDANGYQIQYLDLIMPSIVMGYMTNIPLPVYDAEEVDESDLAKDDVEDVEDANDGEGNVDIERCYEIYNGIGLEALMKEADPNVGKTIDTIKKCVTSNVEFLRQMQTQSKVDDLVNGLMYIMDNITDGVSGFKDEFFKKFSDAMETEQFKTMMDSVTKEAAEKYTESEIEQAVVDKIKG